MERVVANLEWFLKDREDTFHAYEEWSLPHSELIEVLANAVDVKSKKTYESIMALTIEDEKRWIVYDYKRYISTFTLIENTLENILNPEKENY
jgi:hypothetical protein